MNKKRVLITGGMGNIGYELQRYLRGYEIQLLDWREGDFAVNHSFHLLDIAGEGVEEFIRKGQFDVIVHLAGVSRVADAEREPEKTFFCNVEGTRRLLEAVIRSDKKSHLIFASSREVYGNSESLVDENSEVKPLNHYARSKLSAERLLLEKSTLFPLTILRISNVYGGERDHPERFIPKLLSSIREKKKFHLKGRDKKLDFLYIFDLLKIIEHFVESQGRGEIYNISSGRSISLYDLLELTRKLIPDLEVEIEANRSFEVNEILISNRKLLSRYPIVFRDIYDVLPHLLKRGAIDENFSSHPRLSRFLYGGVGGLHL